MYPQYAVVVPHPARIKVPVAYAVRRGDKGMAAFMSRWVELKQKDGTVDQLFDYWIAGREVEKSTERWSIIRDVLGWIE